MIISAQEEERYSYIQNILIQKIRKLYLHIVSVVSVYYYTITFLISNTVSKVVSVYFRFLSRINVHFFNVSVLNWTNSRQFISKSQILNSLCSLDISEN